MTGTDEFGTVGSATITVTDADGGLADTGDNLANTGYDAPMVLIWSAAGALLLGLALVVALSIRRKLGAFLCAVRRCRTRR